MEERLYLLLDSKGTPLANAVLESPQKAEVLQIRVLGGKEEVVAAHQEFQLIGIVSDVMEGEDQSLVESLVQETGANYLHLLANDSIGQAILSSVSAVPTTFFFDGEGAYLGGVVGSAEKSAWEELIHELLEKQ